MALLSLIIPVFRVEKYLAQCLDSVFDQPFADVEVIAVNDGSDDGCAEILSRYAARYDRLQVITLDRNRGLGDARNVGLAYASGSYVWFIDSDDWLPAGTLAAVAEHLVQTRPDLLVTGYARVYEDGRTSHLSVSGVTAGRSVPGTFTLREQPGLLSVLHIACNKVVRRGFLAEIGLTFGSGWYEDVSFSFPLMLAAERITLLDRCCYAYRQRQSGAITQTVSEQHFDVLAHWDRVFAFLDSRPEVAAELRALVFQRMVWHLLQVLGHARRVPTSRRRDFFAGMTDRYQAYRPATGYRIPPGAVGVKHRLVAYRAYHLFEALRTAHRARAALVAHVRSRAVGVATSPVPVALPGSAVTAERPGPAALASVGTRPGPLPVPAALAPGEMRD